MSTITVTSIFLHLLIGIQHRKCLELIWLTKNVFKKTGKCVCIHSKVLKMYRGKNPTLFFCSRRM